MSERIKNTLRKIFNVFFRGNNLLFATVEARLKENTIQIGESTNLNNVIILLKKK